MNRMEGHDVSVKQENEFKQDRRIKKMIEDALLQYTAEGSSVGSTTQAEVARLRLRDKKHTRRINRQRRQIKNLRNRMRILEASLSRLALDQGEEDSSEEST